MRWLRLHAMVAPFGVFAVTLLLVTISGQWGGWENLEPAASLVDLAAVVYGMIAVLVERGVDMVFWALEQRRKRREKLRAEAMAEGIAQGRAEAIAEGRAEGRAEERKRIKALMARISRDTGIPIEKLLPPEDDTE